jgi:malate dehydrogenase (quinone)
MPDTFIAEKDVVLIGAGIMSATLGVFLKELEPSLSIEMFETLEGPALESSEAWNNAGTGHAANCEMNYTPQRADGSIDISKALQVNVEFDLSRQFWSFLVKKGSIKDPRSFICPGSPDELREGRRQCFVPQKEVRGDDGPSLLPRHGIYRG